jgi:hypothetical protein
MHMRSSVKLAAFLALTAVATTACASMKQEQAAASTERTKITREASVDGSGKRADYLKCVLDDANTQAMDPGSDAITPDDLADASLAKCGSLLRGSQEDFSIELFSSGQDVASAAATATRTTEAVRTSARGQAVALIVDARRRRASTPTKAAGT